MSKPVASVTVSVVPDFSGFVDALRKVADQIERTYTPPTMAAEDMAATTERVGKLLGYAILTRHDKFAVGLFAAKAEAREFATTLMVAQVVEVREVSA